MVVVAKIRIKAGSLAGRSERCDQSKFFEPPERPVDRVQRYSGYSLAYSLVDLLHVGVVGGLRHFTENTLSPT